MCQIFLKSLYCQSFDHVPLDAVFVRQLLVLADHYGIPVMQRFYHGLFHALSLQASDDIAHKLEKLALSMGLARTAVQQAAEVIHGAYGSAVTIEHLLNHLKSSIAQPVPAARCS